MSMTLNATKPEVKAPLITDEQSLDGATNEYGRAIPVYDDGYGPLFIHRDSSGIRTAHFVSVEAAIRHFGGDVYTESATDNPKAYVAHGIASGDIIIGRPLLRHGQTLSVINGRYHISEIRD